MNSLPSVMTTLPASSMRREQGVIFTQLAKSPILFTHHGHAAGVLVDPETWNRLLQRLEDLDDTVAALEAKIELLTGEDETISFAEFEELLSGVPA